MKTIVFPRRVMRPTTGDDLPKACGWCRRPLPAGEVFTVGHDLGKVVALCSTCLTPPPHGARPLEIEVED